MVISIISLLPSVVLASLTVARTKAVDARIKSDLNEIRRAVVSYAIDNNLPFNLNGSGCGSGGNAAGWYDGAYGSNISIQECLVSGGYLTLDINDPERAEGTPYNDSNRYMMFPCGGSLILMGNLKSKESPAPEGISCSSYDTTYGMDYFVEVR